MDKKQILLARAADEAMGTSTNGNGGDKENDPLSFSIFITTAFNKRQFYIFSIKDPIALADEDMEMAKLINRQPFPEIY